MGLFKADLFRSFMIGFLIGTAAIATSIGVDTRAELIQKLVP